MVNPHWKCPVCGLRAKLPVNTDKVNCGVCGNLDVEAKLHQIEGPARGLGDTIARVSDFLRIGQCDGCRKRQQMLNELIPYA